MINALIGPDGAPTFAAAVNGIPIYLDNFAVKCLAKGDAKLRERLPQYVTVGRTFYFQSLMQSSWSGHKERRQLQSNPFLTT